jgi:hypothetical protein
LGRCSYRRYVGWSRDISKKVVAITRKTVYDIFINYLDYIGNDAHFLILRDVDVTSNSKAKPPANAGERGKSYAVVFEIKKLRS